VATSVDSITSKLEPLSATDEQAPVRAAYRYIENRPHQLNYQAAIAADLPVQARLKAPHRYVILERLDIAGAWWTVVESSGIIVAASPCKSSVE